MSPAEFLRPETELTIFELRASDPAGLDFLAGPPEPEERFGPSLAGLHLEGDFAFLFFTEDYCLDPFLEDCPFIEVRQIHRLRYDQWQDGAWMEAMTSGPLTVCPVWAAAGPGPKASGLEPIIIDPGLAFGFGGHPTTKACLGFLVRLLRPGTAAVPVIRTALDLGTGTGILALAAARLGAGEILGVDHSHLAVRSARKNVLLNRLEGRVRIERGLAQAYAGRPGQLVMANLPLFVLQELLESGAFDGREHLIYSGLLPSEGEIFLEELTRRLGGKFILRDCFRGDRWISGLVDFTGG
ncbi:MAG: 50S ribosomal protein L11 methyltransferase [Deltaproteobacteria bacterium]|jgi:ribosomal protein L11 methyltransferase|nr:50S ribosomal protein L11 methyltransferase [Deltaproteobacteria bacterium]